MNSMPYSCLRLLPAMLLALPVAGSAADQDQGAEGYDEIMARDHVDPPDAPPDTMAYTSAHLKILATEITAGPDGPSLPVFLNYSPDGTDARMHQFAGGVAVNSGATEDATFTSSIHGFNLIATCRTHTVSSGSGNCLVLRNHDELSGFLTRHHIQRPFGHQLAIEAILKPYLDAQGHMTLDDDERIALFELGTTDPTNAAYDFQDLVVLVRLGTPKPYHRGDF
jgi:hypothetical protein